MDERVVFYSFIRILSSNKTMKINKTESQARTLINLTKAARHRRIHTPWWLNSEKAMAPHSSTLAWKMPWAEEPGGLQSMGSPGVGHDSVTSLSLSCIGEGNGNPLQCSCLQNPRGGGAWWAAIYGVSQSRTRLKRLSSSRHRYQYFLFLFQSLFQCQEKLLML